MMFSNLSGCLLVKCLGIGLLDGGWTVHFPYFNNSNLVHTIVPHNINIYMQTYDTKKQLKRKDSKYDKNK